MGVWSAAAAFLMLMLSVQAASAQVDERFDGGFTEDKWWCTCQIDNINSPVTFPVDRSDREILYAQIEVNEYAPGGNVCRSDAPDFECGRPQNVVALQSALRSSLESGVPVPPSLEAVAPPESTDLPESLGPSFFQPRALRSGLEMAAPALVPPPQRNPYCTDGVELRAHRRHEDDECVQRQELRLLGKKESQIPQLFSFGFRMPPEEELGDTLNSIRWIIAQWKAEPLSKDYSELYGEAWGPSPFLALRFDDGILHVTVQDQDCRCIVASARAGISEVWPGNEDGCQIAASGPMEGRRCSPEFRAYSDGEPVLSSPAGHWVTLKFQVQSSRNNDATIKIWDGDRLVVRVEGNIGYKFVERESGKKTSTKFKIGHYRDYTPFPATMDIDWLKVEKVQ